MNSGNLISFSPFKFANILSFNSVASSIIVTSAAKLVSNTPSNPNLFKAVVNFLVISTPGAIPNSSPIATLTAGAT